MRKILLDSNAIDELYGIENSKNVILNAVNAGDIQLIVTSELEDEYRNIPSPINEYITGLEFEKVVTEAGIWGKSKWGEL